MAGAAVLVAVCGLVWWVWPRSQAAEPPDWTSVAAERQPMVAEVLASGTIAPEQSATISFLSSGPVASIKVAVGDTVAANALLATLDDSQQQIELTRAQAQLDQAIASRERQLEGATPAEIAAAEAQLSTARGNLQQTLGNVTDADIQAARAQVRQAQASLDTLLAGPKSADVAAARASLDSASASRDAAQAQLDSANAALEQNRTTLSATKTQAESALQQSANVVRERQASYATIRDQNQRLRDAGFDPPQDAINAENSAKLNLDNAQLELNNAQVAYDSARQNEIDGLAQAQAQVDQAQAGLDQAQAQVDQAQANLAKLTSPAEADQLAQAQASLASAKANLSRLQGANRAGSVAAAQGNVSQAQANLDKVLADTNASDLAVADAQVRAAEATRDLAQLQVERMVLRAPFAGTVAAVNLTVGEAPRADAIRLVDQSKLHLDVSVDEIDVARVQAGQPVTVTLDALPELALPGTVRAVSPLAADDSSGAVSYIVRIDLLKTDPAVRPGMSATAAIQVANKPNALVISRRAVHQDGQRVTVALITGAAPAANQRPPTSEVEVELGLTNEQFVEVLAGLKEGDKVLVEGINANYLQRVGGGR